MNAPLSSEQTPVEVPASAMPHRRPNELLALAEQGLRDAAATKGPGGRYATAHLSALRAAAAVLAARARPLPAGTRRARTRPTSVWVLLTQVAPELGEWATHFALAAITRAAAEAGLPNVVDDRQADDMVRDAEAFVALVGRSLGGPR